MLRSLLVGALLGGTAATACEAASLSVAPTRVELGPGDPAAVVTLQNNAAEPVMVQVQTFAWPRSLASGVLEPTRELLAVPPVAELAGNAKQIIRVALRAPLTGGREQAYRLLITEVPRGSARTTGVRFALRLSLPVFVTPDGAEARPVWSVRANEHGTPELVLRNEGEAHIQVRRIVWRLDGRAAATVIEAPAYVLAGREHDWPLPPGTGAASLEIEAETNLGLLRATVASSRG